MAEKYTLQVPPKEVITRHESSDTQPTHVWEVILDFKRVLKSRDAEVVPAQSKSQQGQFLPSLTRDVVEPKRSFLGTNSGGEVSC